MLSEADPVAENSLLQSGGCVSSTGKLYQDGGEWQEDPCTTCTCTTGMKKCQAHMCVLRCDHARYVPDECCPLCDGKACLNSVRPKGEGWQGYSPSDIIRTSKWRRGWWAGHCRLVTTYTVCVHLHVSMPHHISRFWHLRSYLKFPVSLPPPSESILSADDDDHACYVYHVAYLVLMCRCVLTYAGGQFVIGPCGNVLFTATSVVTIPPHCPALSNCSLRCVHGFVRDDDGCYTCQCQAGKHDINL